jgi:hypothetical protein
MARLGEAAAAPVSLDEALARGCLEQTQVLTCARLADPHCSGGGRDAAPPLDFDEQAEPCRVPEE